MGAENKDTDMLGMSDEDFLNLSGPPETEPVGSTEGAQPETAQEEEKTTARIFHGEFPISVSLMTPSGIPVHFYAGYHATEDEEVIEFLKAEKSVKEVTGKIKLSELPVAPSRNRGRRSGGWCR